jgi:amino acid transporter
MSSTSRTSAALGRPVLTTIDAIAQSLAIGPVFSAALLGALIAGAAGPVAPLAALLGAAGMLAVGWVIALYARRYAGAGAIYDYVRQAVNPSAGVFAAGIYFIGTLFLGGAGIYLALGLIGSSTLSALFAWQLPWWLIAALAALLIFGINHIGVQVTTRVQLLLTALSLAPLLLLALVVIATGGAAGNTSAVFDPGNAPAASLFRGLLFAVTLFIGFEASASLGEETADPYRSIPRAIFGTVAIATVFYLLMIYASAIGFGVAGVDQWVSDPAPLSTLARRYVGDWLAALIDIALLIDMLAVASAFTATSSRGWFALARDGLLPAVFARSSRFGTPLGGNLVVLLSALLLLGGTLLAGIDPLAAFGITATTGALLIEGIYIGLALAAARLLRAESAPWWQWLLLLIAGIAPGLGIYGSVVPFPAWPLNIAVYGALLSVLLVGLWTLALRRLAPGHLTGSAAVRGELPGIVETAAS